MKPLTACPQCEGITDLPHHSEADCFRAIDREIKGTLAHLRSLARRRSKLLQKRITRRHRASAVRRRALI